MAIGGRDTLSVELVHLNEGGNSTGARHKCGPKKPASLPEVMSGSVAAIVDEHIMVCGGRGVTRCYNYYYEGEEEEGGGGGEWVESWASLDRPRQQSASFVHNNALYVLGGYDVSYDGISSTLIYEGGSFRPGKKLLEVSHSPCAALVNGTHFFFAGIRKTYLVEISGWIWTLLPPRQNAMGAIYCGRVKGGAGDTSIVIGNGIWVSSISLESLTWTGSRNQNPTPRQIAQLKHNFLTLGGYDKNLLGPGRAISEIGPNNPESPILRPERLAEARKYHAIVPIPDGFFKC